jgi:hypothetical protein
VLRHFVDHDIRLPDRLRTGAAKGELEWRRPNRPTLIDMLHNPIYAGCYAYGRRSVEASRRQPGQRATGRRRGHDLDDGVIVLHDRLPAYISWDRYVTNLEKMAANRSEHLGVPRHGPALLSGLLVCGRCGHRMFTAYKNNGRDLRYFCGAEYASYAAPICQTLAGRVLDEHITGLVLQAMMPSALETSLQLAEDLELERAERHRQWKLRLERARYDAERARRQYSAVEPENRLVARTLERQWEGGPGRGTTPAGGVRAVPGLRTDPADAGGAGSDPASGRGHSGPLAGADHDRDRSSGIDPAAAGAHRRHRCRDDGGGDGRLPLGGGRPDPDRPAPAGRPADAAERL